MVELLKELLPMLLKGLNVRLIVLVVVLSLLIGCGGYYGIYKAEAYITGKVIEEIDLRIKGIEGKIDILIKILKNK